MQICQTFKCIRCGEIVAIGDVAIMPRKGESIFGNCKKSNKPHLIIPSFYYLFHRFFSKK